MNNSSDRSFDILVTGNLEEESSAISQVESSYFFHFLSLFLSLFHLDTRFRRVSAIESSSSCWEHWIQAADRWGRNYGILDLPRRISVDPYARRSGTSRALPPACSSSCPWKSFHEIFIFSPIRVIKILFRGDATQKKKKKKLIKYLSSNFHFVELKGETFNSCKLKSA